MPEMDRWAPMATARSASSGPPVKQWNTVRRGTPSVPRIRNVSSHASRVWMTSGRSTWCASAIWRANASCCTSRGEWS